MTNGYEILGKGIYTISEAARLSGITWPRIRHWIRGDLRNPRGERTPTPPIVETELGKRDGVYSVSFLDLIELLMIEKFRKMGVSIQAVRRAHEKATLVFNNSHPFAMKKFWTDGNDILVDVGIETKDQALLNLRKDQFELRQNHHDLFKFNQHL